MPLEWPYIVISAFITVSPFQPLITFAQSHQQSNRFIFFDNVFQEIIPVQDTNVLALRQEYDFIIIGSGSGGSVMANRLSEINEFNVLLLEAGDQESFLSDVPLTAALTQITRYNWGYKSEPTANACQGLEGGVCNWIKGRALGGTSVVNYMLYSRGHRSDFDEWASYGNDGWSYKDILPYFKKSERIAITELLDSPYHGKTGPLDVVYPPFQTKLVRGFLKAGRELGYNVTDPNGALEIGFSRVQANLRNGRRCSAAKAFINPAARRRNLHISIKSWVTKIIIDEMTKTAVAVEFLKNKKRYVIRAKKEVILSAGTIASPQLLMLSGIGPRDHLQSLGIPVIQDLKVGYNLQDHVSMAGLTFLVNQPITILESLVMNPIDIFHYIFQRTGPYTIPGGAEAFAFLKTENSSYDADYPDIEVVLGAGSITGDFSGSMRNLLGMTDEFYQKVYRDVIGKHAFGLVPVLMRPKSRGRVSLKNRNPFQWPRMEPNYLNDPEDMETMVKGIKLILRLAESKSFRQFGTKFHKTPYLGCETQPFGSDEYWRCCLRVLGSSLQHQVGTCKMGPRGDPDAVVNPQLQVHGVNRLRVVDASIIPTIPAGHTNAAVFMIGEKAADMVKEYWRVRT